MDKPFFREASLNENAPVSDQGVRKGVEKNAPA